MKTKELLDKIKEHEKLLQEQEGEGKKKPGSHLTPEKRSETAKRARKGEDIGKPGKKFKEVAAKAKKGGARDPEAVAAASMWRAIKADLDWEDLPEKIQIAILSEIEEQDEEKAKATSENEGGAKDKWTIADFKDQIEDWKKAGYDDEKKLQGMIDKATEIAKKSTESAPGKATRAEVLGILQGFFQEKG